MQQTETIIKFELVRCFNCGSKATLTHEHGGYFMDCHQCGANNYQTTKFNPKSFARSKY